MSIGTTDIFLLVIIVAALIVGFFWGAARSLMLLAVWLLAFLAGAYLRLELGSYLASQWTNFAASFSEMAAFGLIYGGLLIASPFIIMTIMRGDQRVARYQVLDDFAGAAFAVLVAVLGIAGVMIVLSTFYVAEGTVVDPSGGPMWTADLYESLLASNIGQAIDERVIPILGSVLGPILPPDVREVMA